MCLLRPLIPGALADAVPAEISPPALEVDGSPAYQFRALLDSSRRGGHIENLVDWEQSWVPLILDPNLFWELYLNHPARSPPQGHLPGQRHSTAGAGILKTGNHSISPVNYSISLGVSLLIIQSVCLCFRLSFTLPVFTII